MNRNLPMDTNKNRYENRCRPLFGGAEVANPNSLTFEWREKTTAAEVGWNLSDKTEPSRCQETAVAAEGAGTGATMNEWDRSTDCIERSTTGRTLAAKCDEFVETMPDRVWPVVTGKTPADDTGVMRCQWND